MKLWKSNNDKRKYNIDNDLIPQVNEALKDEILFYVTSGIKKSTEKTSIEVERNKELDFQKDRKERLFTIPIKQVKGGSHTMERLNLKSFVLNFFYSNYEAVVEADHHDVYYVSFMKNNIINIFIYIILVNAKR